MAKSQIIGGERLRKRLNAFPGTDGFAIAPRFTSIESVVFRGVQALRGGSPFMSGKALFFFRNKANRSLPPEKETSTSATVGAGTKPPSRAAWRRCNLWSALWRLRSSVVS